MKDSRRSFIKKVTLAASGMTGIAATGHAAVGHRVESNAIKRNELRYDLLVYGGTSGGVIAAYTAKKHGLNVLLVEPGRHLGGLSSGGLGATDTGGKEHVIVGMASDFYARVGKFYGKDRPVYRFEPHVAELIFNSYVNESELDVLYSRRVKSVRVRGTKIERIELENSANPSDTQSIVATHFIDASYEGDLMAKAGVTYTIGRESNQVYNEKYNGIVLSRLAGKDGGHVIRTSEWPVAVDPYVMPGKPSSRLLPEINDIECRPDGEGDKSVQSYWFRL